MIFTRWRLEDGRPKMRSRARRTSTATRLDGHSRTGVPTTRRSSTRTCPAELPRGKRPRHAAEETPGDKDVRVENNPHLERRTLEMALAISARRTPDVACRAA